jgi:hypothetical protein
LACYRRLGARALDQRQRRAQPFSQRRRKVARCRHQHRPELALQQAMGTRLAGGAHDVERNDVAGALPDRAKVGLAQEPRLDPLLDVTVAAPHFHGIARDLARIPACPELDQRRENAPQRLCRPIAQIGALQTVGGKKCQAEGGLGRQDHFDELPAHQRQLDQALPEGVPAERHGQGLVHGAPHHAGGAHAVRQP